MVFIRLTTHYLLGQPEAKRCPTHLPLCLQGGCVGLHTWHGAVWCRAIFGDKTEFSHSLSAP